METSILVLTIIFGLYMAFSIGANDFANTMGTSVGSGTITFRKAIILAALFELAGAILAGGHVTETFRDTIIVHTDKSITGQMLARGILAALLGSAFWIHMATFLGLPVSTTHAIIGGLTGFAVSVGGGSSVLSGSTAMIYVSWVVSPVLGGISSFALTYWMRKKIYSSDSLNRFMKYLPWLLFVVFFILISSLLYKDLAGFRFDYNLYVSLPLLILACGALSFLVSGRIKKKLVISSNITPGTLPENEQVRKIETVFMGLQLITACFIAFAHGSNDVANVTAPVLSILTSDNASGSIGNSVPLWLLGLGAAGIILGMALYGRKVTGIMGEKITLLTPSSGFAAQFGAAAVILIASKLGLPVSTTHTVVGAIAGVGIAGGLSALNRSLLKNIGLSWLVTYPVAALLSITFYRILDFIF